MITITVHTDEGTISCAHETGATLLHTLQVNRIGLGAPCGGIGRCGKCLVTVDDGSAAGPVFDPSVEVDGAGPGPRLACRSVPVRDFVVDLRGRTVKTSLSAESKGGAIAVPPDGDPVARSIAMTLASPSLEDQQSVQQRIENEVEDARVQLQAVVDGQKLVGGDAAALVIEGRDGREIVGVDREVRDCLPAVAIDVGTTTVAAYLIDVAARRVLAARSAENAQKPFGADVVARITAVHDGHDLSAVIRDQLAHLIDELALDGGVQSNEIVAATVVGNPTMMHILYGLDPWSIGQSPFMPATTSRLSSTMHDLGLPGHRTARIDCAPAMSAYVGADIVADLLTISDAPACYLLIDIGTNGEMVMVADGRLYACSTAAGPAFEGASIRCGAGGIAGAIDHVLISDDRFEIETIQDAPPVAICGSGLIDAMAGMLTAGIVDESGRMMEDRGDTAYHLTTVDGEPALLLAERSDGPDVVLTQADVRQVQLAKGAIAAGVRTLLDEAGISAADLETVYLAGGFGAYVNPDSASRVGLIPPDSGGTVTSLGNAAGAGAARLLVDQDAWTTATTLARGGRYVELSSSARFLEFFVEEMMFPE